MVRGERVNVLVVRGLGLPFVVRTALVRCVGGIHVLFVQVTRPLQVVGVVRVTRVVRMARVTWVIRMTKVRGMARVVCKMPRLIEMTCVLQVTSVAIDSVLQG